MAQNVIASPGLAPEIRQAYFKQLLRVAVPEFVHDKYAKKSPIPKGEGTVGNWRRFRRITPQTTPLTESVTPTPLQLTVDNIQVTASQYGGWMSFSDLVVTASIDPILSENNELLGICAGETIDVIARDAFNVGTTILYANSRSSRITVAAGDVITDADIKRLARTLKNNLARPFTAGGKKYYVAIVHPSVYYDLQSTDGFKNTGFYSDPAKIYEGTVIMLYGIMFVETTQAKIFAGAGAAGIDVYSTLCFGTEALGSTEITSLGLEMIYKGPGSGGTSDPLNQRQTQGFKCTYAGKILNDAFLVRYESAVGA